MKTILCVFNLKNSFQWNGFGFADVVVSISLTIFELCVSLATGLITLTAFFIFY